MYDLFELCKGVMTSFLIPVVFSGKENMII